MTAVFLILAADRLTGDLLQIGVVAIGSVTFATAISGVLIAAAQVIGQDDGEAAPETCSVEDGGTATGPGARATGRETVGGSDGPDGAGDHDRQ